MSKSTPKIIKDGKIVNDPWVIIHDIIQDTPESADIIVTIAFWHSHHDELLQHKGRLGVWVKPDDDVTDIADDLEYFDLIAIDFPVFTDGRGYSSAYLLRTRYDYQGELRAVGDVLRDQMFYMQRVGFNAFAVRADCDIKEALKSLKDFSETYQGSADDPIPHFRRTPGS